MIPKVRTNTQAAATATLGLCLMLASCRCPSKDSPTPPTIQPRQAGPSKPSRPSPTPSAGGLLGGERGVDHIGIAVPNLVAAQKTYQDILGFANPKEGRLPNGIQNVNYYFGDATYLETLTHYDAKKAPWLAAFTAKHKGPLFGVISIKSASQTAAFLKAKGFPTAPPVAGSIETKGAPKTAPKDRWQTLFFAKSPLAGDPLYFIEYDAAMRETFIARLGDKYLRRRFFRHPNTAMGLRAFWIAVEDLAAAVKTYSAIGFHPATDITDTRMGAQGKIFRAGEGYLVILAPQDPKGTVAQFLKVRGPGVIGLTVKVASLVAAREWIKKSANRDLPSYNGSFGPSLLVPPDLAEGAWLEFAQISPEEIKQELQ